jgi:putative oxidoreductase
MASKGMPFPEVFLVPTIIIELGGGLLLAVGYKARWAALAIFLFLIPTTLIFHAFWAVDAEQMQMQMIQFQKNLAIMGGMLYVVVNGAGPWSVDKD